MTDIPPAAIRAFDAHRQNAKRRGTPFLFTLPEWWAWWQLDGRWEHRGMGRDALVMARKGDVGPYSVENVDCITHAQNMAAIPPEKRANGAARRWARQRELGIPCHLAVRGDAHPRSRAVITPLGRFGSAALAAEAHGITRQGAGHRARTGTDGWRYE
jgi:hypothetical protein